MTKDEEAIAKVMPADGEFIPFDGCDEEGCRGWDGKDRRCDCGNRRVYWTVEAGFAYPETD